MKNNQEEITTILSIAFLYTVITGIFTFLHKLSTLISSNEIINIRIHMFLQRNALWVIVVTAIVILLSVYLKRSNQRIRFILTDNSIVGFTTGALVILEGLFDLSSSIPLTIISVESVIRAARQIDVSLDGSAEGMILRVVIANILSAVIILCQIISGIFLIKVNKKRAN